MNTNKPQVIFNIYPSGGQAGNIYDPQFIAPTLMGYAAGGGGKEVKIVEERDNSNRQCISE